jgi:hypothetical protein
MSCRAKAIVTLVLIAPVLTEIVSGNTPPHALLHPSISLFLLAAYSFPLLALRELSVRWGLHTPGIFVLGLAYGLLNEGLLAQTLIRATGVPMPNFDNYAYAGGINFSWTWVIVPWHALLAVVFPLRLLDCWFPQCAGVKWLDRRAFAVLTAILIGGVTFISFARKPHVQMIAFWVAIAALVVGASLFRNKRQPGKRRNSLRTVAFGFGIFFYWAFFLGSILLATARVQPAMFFGAVAAILIAFGWMSRRYGFEPQPAAAHVALGAYFAAASFNLAGGLEHQSLETMLTGGVLAVAFIALARLFPRAPQNSAA